MLKVKVSTIIYICCPSNAVTGGPEALHQLCDKINLYGGISKLVYLDYGTQEVDSNARTPSRYKHYFIKTASQIIDQSENILIVPEIWPHLLMSYKNIQKCIWWLSVDYGNEKFKQGFSDQTIFHFYQSWYAKQYLLANNASNIYPLFDYISIRKIDFRNLKEKIVIYNPKKGLETTKKIINLFAATDIKFVALENLSRLELAKLMKRSSVYIDFGNHPGKDRMPREASIYNNVIITSRVGSANNFDDVPINEEYKFHLDDLLNVKQCIINSISGYDKAIENFDFYRRSICNQELEFSIQVMNLFIQKSRISFMIILFSAIQKTYKVYFDSMEIIANKLKKYIPNRLKPRLKKIRDFL